MRMDTRSKPLMAWASLAVILGLTTTAAQGQERGNGDPDIGAELQSLKARIAELEARQNENWLTEERASQIRGIVQDVLKDAQTRNQAADGPDIGYKDGFFIQTPDKNFKLLINAFVQARYEYGYHRDPNTSDSLHPISPTRNEEDSSGFDIRRARIKLTGNVFSPNLIYKFYGDFYGASTGAFTVLEVYAGYNFSDMFKVKAGSMEVPFAKDSLDSDTKLLLMARPESFTALLGSDTPRALGVSLYGDIIKDKLSYEVQANDGMNTNTLRRADTLGTTNNLDNRMGFYARMAFAGNGSLKDFGDEPDMRTDNRDLIWMLGAAGGYESQSVATDTLPSPQGTAVGGVSNGNGPGFKTYTLNGDIFRATVDWSAKYQGWSFQTAGLFQQINANAGTGAALPFGPNGKSSFFQQGYYAQVGYMLIPNRLEIAGRVGYILTEGFPNIAEYYTLGTNYYIFGHNAKLQADVTYSPESAFTDASETQLQNTHNLSFRVQFQVMF
jgi:hypothetical protein